ncbi:alpha/beta fold hydrolase [Paenibacillus sp. MBLB4367]|uniref:alpha/beta fold hydrolase n=1 Tax=Paenibacillus sp. MBLB4367 TaxID=3384767 RepID=UPI0039081EB9
MAKKAITINESKLAYTDQGSGLPVVLLHGFCGSGAYWDQVVPTLAQHYRVIVPDQRGHGESDAPEDVYTMEVLAEDVAQLLRTLKIDKAVLLGHSLGGYVALAFAERYPKKLKGFGLIHSAAFPDDEQGKTNRTKNMNLIREKGLDPFIEGLIPKLFAPEHVESMPEQVEKALKIGKATKRDGAIRTLAGMRVRPDRTAVLKGAKVPVLLVAGEKDQIVAPDKTFNVNKPNMHKFLLEEAGHMSMYEAPEMLLEAIQLFLNEKVQA